MCGVWGSVWVLCPMTFCCLILLFVDWLFVDCCSCVGDWAWLWLVAGMVVLCLVWSCVCVGGGGVRGLRVWAEGAQRLGVTCRVPILSLHDGTRRTAGGDTREARSVQSVSYTHLTLPTKMIV